MVLPTDTVYGLGADAFNPKAVTDLLAAKGRGRNMPPPVLVGSVRAAAALTESLGAFGQDLIDEFWPGPLTLVFRASQTSSGSRDTLGTVAVRMPLPRSPLTCCAAPARWPCRARRRTFPPPPPGIEAQRQLSDAIFVYLTHRPCADNVTSTILDLTGTVPRLLRAGASPSTTSGRSSGSSTCRAAGPAGTQPGRPAGRGSDRRRERGRRG